MSTCKCGCGDSEKGRRVFVNKDHQLRWMSSGGAAELNAMQPLEAKAHGGAPAGKLSIANGQLAEASKKGADRVHFHPLLTLIGLDQFSTARISDQVDRKERAKR